jgi:hypothetical protein
MTSACASEIPDLLPARPRWPPLRTRAVWAYGAFVALAVFAFTRGVVLVNDGHVYMEMARSALRGSLEVENGLDLVFSPELWLVHTVQSGPHLYPKYPPFYGPLAALPFAALGVRGLYALNALALAAAFPAFHRLARRLLPTRHADLATLLLPFGTPIVPYALIELPHLVTMTAILWAIVFWDESLREDSHQRDGLASGLFAGLAFGVRIQSVILFVALVGVGATTAHRRRSARAPLLAMVGAFLGCLALVSAINVVRFGSPNPFSYGVAPAFSLIAAATEERLTFFARPGVVLVGLVAMATLLGARTARTARGAALSLAAGVVVLVSVPLLRQQAAQLLLTMTTLLVNASVGGGGWTSPITTLGWMNKALLVAAPFLALGLVAVARSVARPAPPLETALGWMVVLLLGFLSLRDPDSRGDHGAMGFFSFTPRYLVELMPLLYLLAWTFLDSVRLAPSHAIAGAGAWIGITVLLWISGPGDRSVIKVAILSDAPLAIGLVLAISALLAPRARLLGAALAPLLALAHASTFASAIAEDARALVGIASQYDRWGESFLTVAPPRIAVVGWWFAKDPIFHLRAGREVVTVDAAVDDGATLADTLDQLVARGMTPYYFGLELERALPHLLGRYRAVPVLQDPIVFRLELVSP